MCMFFHCARRYLTPLFSTLVSSTFFSFLKLNIFGCGLVAQFTNYYQFDSNQVCESSQILYLLEFKNYYSKSFFVKKNGERVVVVIVRAFKISYTDRNMDIYSKTLIHIHVYQYNVWLSISQKICLHLRVSYLFLLCSCRKWQMNDQLSVILHQVEW